MQIKLYIVLFVSILAGSPPPSVKWLQNGQELSTEIMDFTFPSRLTNKLVVKNLSRIHQHAVYTCQASNFPKKFVSKNITIDLYREYYILTHGGLFCHATSINLSINCLFIIFYQFLNT